MDDMFNFVSMKGVNIMDMYQSSHPESLHKSFVMEVKAVEMQKMMNMSWPEGLIIREYTERHERKQGGAGVFLN